MNIIKDMCDGAITRVKTNDVCSSSFDMVASSLFIKLIFYLQ